MKREQENSQVPEMLLAKKKKKTKTLNKFVSETDSFVSRSIYISKIVPSSRGYPLWNHCKYPMSMDTCNGSITDIHLCILCHSHNGQHLFILLMAVCWNLMKCISRWGSIGLDQILEKSDELCQSLNKFKLLGVEDLPTRIEIYSYYTFGKQNR